MGFQRTDGGNQNHRRGVQVCHAALDIQELFSAQVSAKACFGHNVIRQLQAQLGGSHAVAAVGNVGKWTAVDDGGVVFQRLDQVGVNGVFQQSRHCACCADLPGGDRLAIVSISAHNAAQAVFQVGQVGGQAEDGHDLAGNGDVKAVLARGAVHLAAQAVHNKAQLAVIHVHAALPGDAAGVNVQRVALLDGVVDHGSQQVVCGANGVDIAGKVQVDIFHGHNLGVTAARSAALYTEHGPKGGLTQAEHRLFTHGVQGVRQANTGGGFALASRGGADGGHQDQLAVWAVTVDQLVVDLGFVTAIRDQVLVCKAQLFRYFGNGQHLGCLCNFNVAQHMAIPPFTKNKGLRTPYISVCSPDGRLNAGNSPLPRWSCPPDSVSQRPCVIVTVSHRHTVCQANFWRIQTE